MYSHETTPMANINVVDKQIPEIDWTIQAIKKENKFIQDAETKEEKFKNNDTFLWELEYELAES